MMLKTPRLQLLSTTRRGDKEMRLKMRRSAPTPALRHSSPPMTCGYSPIPSSWRESAPPPLFLPFLRQAPFLAGWERHGISLTTSKPVLVFPCVPPPLPCLSHGREASPPIVTSPNSPTSPHPPCHHQRGGGEER